MKRNILTALYVIAFFTGAFAVDKAAAGRQWVDYGNKLATKGYYERAIVAYEKAIYIDTNNSEAFENSGKLYVKLNDKQTAIDYLKVAYDLNNKPELGKITKSLLEDTLGYRSLRFYPFTFNVLLSGGLNFLTNKYNSFAMSGSCGGGVYVFYHFNDYFAVESGIAANYEIDLDKILLQIDVPLAVAFKFGYSSPIKSILSAGGYTAFKTADKRAFGSGQKNGTDLGLHLGYQLNLMFDKWGFVLGPTVQYSLMDTSLPIQPHTLNIVFNLGVLF